jgi:pimeloyl-ACP methyl ester carboxylesterase
VAAAVLFPGNSGVVSRVRGNFLIRVASQFAAQGITVAVADAPSDHSAGMPDNFRLGQEHADDVAAIIAWLKQRASLPVWLIGTSNGTTSAASAAVHLGPSRVAGVVLTSSVWARGMLYTRFETLRVPLLLVHNRDDGCIVSPFAGAERAMEKINAAPAKQLIAVSGGVLLSSPCEAKSPHGYFGIEDQVVPPIAAWIKSH